jgi:hypothetical protein
MSQERIYQRGRKAVCKKRIIMEQLDIIVETLAGMHITLASVSNQAYGVEVAHAVYQHYRVPRETPPGVVRVRYVWLRSPTVSQGDSEPRDHHLLAVWPVAWQDAEGHGASVAAWKLSPRGVSGDESEPSEASTRQAIEASLAKRPDRYQPVQLSCQRQRYTLVVNRSTTVFREMPAREAIARARSYVAEHERADWRMPTGVVGGIYD